VFSSDFYCAVLFKMTVAVLILYLAACGGLTPTALKLVSSASDDAPIRLNQLGYQPTARKLAVVPASDNTEFLVLKAEDGSPVLKGMLSGSQKWAFSDEYVQLADFSSLTAEGQYVVRVVGIGQSYPFDVASDVLSDVHDAALKSFYLNRSGIDIEIQYGGVHARAAGHPDTQVKVHASAATSDRPEGFVLSSPKGWYDAGDYGKYIVNSGISTYTLLSSYQHFSEYYQTLELSIPESENGVPDILDEIKWNLDWMESMQDSDGGVYHKLTALGFSAIDVMPENEASQRYVIGKSVTAALDYAAVMAVASRVYSEFNDAFSGVSERYKQNALRAYRWARQNPSSLYQQPNDVSTGAYGDRDANDEFSWAAAELFLTTEDTVFLDDFLKYDANPGSNLSWSTVDALGYISLANSGRKLLGDERFAQVVERLVQAANMQLELFETSAYDVAMDSSDFVWGGNSNVLNNGFVLWQAYRLTKEKKYRDAALSTVDYVLGKNATGYSFVTGYGDKTPVNIHHRPSVADKTPVPVPGFIAGGPHTGRQDGCDYPGDKPATNYVDTVCSYSTNEIAINWNAPLVYMLAAANNR